MFRSIPVTDITTASDSSLSHASNRLYESCYVSAVLILIQCTVSGAIINNNNILYSSQQEIKAVI